MSEIEWSTVDRDGHRVIWPSSEDAVFHIVRRIRWGLARPGEERVFVRAISDWLEVGNGQARREGEDPRGAADASAE